MTQGLMDDNSPFEVYKKAQEREVAGLACWGTELDK